MNEQDEIRLRHMLDAAREVVAFAQDHTREDLDGNQMLVRALSMSIGIIGEAASKVSTDVQEAHPEVPWPQIIGMRNRIIHAYFEVNLDILWGTATARIPELIGQIEVSRSVRN
jgi:uncharacterized protein with HEPN domain